MDRPYPPRILGCPPIHGRPRFSLGPRCGSLRRSVIPWYAHGMKTAISLPDELFESADALADRLGMSRSQLYARAVEEYLAKHRDQDITARLNDVYADEESGLDPALRRAQTRTQRSTEW